MKKLFWLIFIGLILTIVYKILTTDNNPLAGMFKDSPREKVQYNELTIDKSVITNIAKFYPVIVDDIKYEVIVVMGSDNKIRTAFNACAVCSGSGLGNYVQQEDYLICKNCGNRFHIDEIGKQRGGCNPAPIMENEKEETEDYIKIPKETFLKNSSLFR